MSVETPEQRELRGLSTFSSVLRVVGVKNKNRGLLLAGGNFRRRYYLAFDIQRNTPMANLSVTIPRRLGIEVCKFARSAGTLLGISV